MALKLISLELENNFGEITEFSNVILRVGTISGDKANIGFVLRFYINDNIIMERYYTLVPSMESNFIAQSYEYLKTLPEYADAVDC